MGYSCEGWFTPRTLWPWRWRPVRSSSWLGKAPKISRRRFSAARRSWRLPCYRTKAKNRGWLGILAVLSSTIYSRCRPLLPGENRKAGRSCSFPKHFSANLAAFLYFYLVLLWSRLKKYLNRPNQYLPSRFAPRLNQATSLGAPELRRLRCSQQTGTAGCGLGYARFEENRVL